MTEQESTGWFVYIVQCSDTTLYTGITTDPRRRLGEHNSARSGARYTRSRQPVRYCYLERSENRSCASKREYELKKLDRKRKQQLISQSLSNSEELISTFI